MVVSHSAICAQPSWVQCALTRSAPTGAEGASRHSPALTPSGKSWPPWKTRGGRACEHPCSWRPLPTPAELPSQGHCIKDRPMGRRSITTRPICSGVSAAPELTGSCATEHCHAAFLSMVLCSARPTLTTVSSPHKPGSAGTPWLAHLSRSWRTPL